MEPTNKTKAIVLAPPQQVAVRRPFLVERAIRSLPVLKIGEQSIREICAALEDFNFDIRAKALEKIAVLGSQIKPSRRYYEAIVFSLVENFSECDSRQLHLFYQGSHYPPDAEYRNLLHATWKALTGSSGSLDEVIMDLLYYGSQDSKVRALEWLANHHLSENVQKELVQYVSVAITSNRRKKHTVPTVGRLTDYIL